MLCLNGFELYSRWVPLRYPYDLRSQISLCILPKNAPYDCCYFHIAKFSGDIYRTKVDNTTVSYIFYVCYWRPGRHFT